VTTFPAQRKLLPIFMDMLVAHKATVGYRQLRPMVTKDIETVAAFIEMLKHGVEMDCSEAITLLYHLAGFPSPHGRTLGFGGWGNTDTILHGPMKTYTNPALAGIGVIAILGADRGLDGQHAAMVRKPGADPLMFSHGHAGSPDDPEFYHLSDIRAGVPGEVVFCNLSTL
jgi:hypothetical protein